ncbi:histidine-rich glycoprotein-like [Nilaparvata lugens]|uniref:histidine-rich glycoprotein-like n=1 Tax=Nilaparvata lugens TaxID=108931 RepID=UPI00193E9980|nr:histidine-rich glycoprotein-like [Nilaparvata lugens]
MINCKTLIIFTTIVFLSAESRPFGDLLRALISGHLLHPHTRTVDHHHYYTDNTHRRNDLVHAPHYHHYDIHHPHLHPPNGELLHRVHSDRQPGVICCRINPLQPYYKQPTAPSEHHVEGHLDHHGLVQGVNNHASGLHTSVIYHGHIGDHQSPPHHHHQMIDCDKLHKKEHDEKHHEGHDDKLQGGHDDKHHNDQSGEHHKEHNKHHEDHSVEHHDKHHDKHHHEDHHTGSHGDHHSHEDHSDEHHNDDHHEDNTPAVDVSNIDEKPSYEVFENVSDVPKESLSKSNVNEINKKSEDNIVFS